jgi:hypothetical protein
MHFPGHNYRGQRHTQHINNHRKYNYTREHDRHHRDGIQNIAPISTISNTTTATPTTKNSHTVWSTHIYTTTITTGINQHSRTMATTTTNTVTTPTITN